MTTRARVVYLAGTAQGVVLVSFPAASTVLTSPSQYGLSETRYGLLFVPQVVLAIGAAAVGGRLSQRWGVKAVYLTGLLVNLLAMLLLLSSLGVADQPSVAYPVLLTATACVGAGFGLTVPALNTLTATFHPNRVDASVLVLNALLGLGTVLAPVFVAVFVSLGFWWGMPLVTAVLVAALIGVSLRMPLAVTADERASARPGRPSRRLPKRYSLYLSIAVLYGLCETMNGNWSQLDMTRDVGASAVLAAVALTAFWAAVTVGRLGFAASVRWFPARRVYQVLPFVLALAMLAVGLVPGGRPWLAVAAFGLAGLGCSALLPLTISLAQDEFGRTEPVVAGGVIAAYQVGYGVAAFAVGPLLAAGVRLPVVFVSAAGVALILGGLSIAVFAHHTSTARR